MFSMLGKYFRRQHFDIFFLFPQNTGLDILYKLFKNTFCMKCQPYLKCQVLFSEEKTTKNFQVDSS